MKRGLFISSLLVLGVGTGVVGSLWESSKMLGSTGELPLAVRTEIDSAPAPLVMGLATSSLIHGQAGTAIVVTTFADYAKRFVDGDQSIRCYDKDFQAGVALHARHDERTGKSIISVPFVAPDIARDGVAIPERWRRDTYFYSAYQDLGFASKKLTTCNAYYFPIDSDSDHGCIVLTWRVR